MRSFTRVLFLVGFSFLLGSCSAARTGVIDGTLTTNLRPAISIAANAPFALAGSGRVWAYPFSKEMARGIAASFDFAVYTDKSVSPADRFAYAAIIRLDDDANWVFVPQGHGLPGMFAGRKRVEPASREGSLYSLHVNSRGDWASELLQANGTETPEAWLAKRWVFSLDKGVRAMAEYREPWPQDLDVPGSGIMPLRDPQAEFLRDFERRALEAFTFGTEFGDFSGVAQAGQAWIMPRSGPDIEKLVGEVMRVMHDDGGSGNFD